MTEEIIASRGLLHSAMDRYIKTCLDAEKLFLDRTVPEDDIRGLTSGLLNELDLFPSYQLKLSKAKATICSVRNLVPHIVPISRLPPDILVQIFQLVTSEHNCGSPNRTNVHEYSLPKYPRLLTQVCSYWRQVVTVAKDLWSHVDIPSHRLRDETVVTRIEEYIARSGSCPLDIHIIEPGIAYHPVTHHSITRLLSPIASRIQSLDLELGKLRAPIAFRNPLSPGACYSSILNTCFSNSKAGTLTRLTVSLEDISPGSRRCFIVPNAQSHGNNSTFPVTGGETVSIPIPEQAFESLLMPVTILNLKGCYPRWTSKAYHGLVELRLGTGPSIAETSLRAVLSSSPRLRFLQFGLHITEPSSPYRKVTPVSLNELETLEIMTSNLEALAHFLRLIRPGPCPLSISVGERQTFVTRLVPTGLLPISEFFARTNLEMLTLSGYYNILQPVHLLKLVPRVGVLVLSGMDLSWVKPDDYKAKKGVSISSQVDAIYIVHGTKISREFLLWIIESHRIQTFTLAKGSKITRVRGIFRGKQPLMLALSSLGCTFKSIASDASYPIRN